MMTKEHLLEEMNAAPRLCVLLLRCEEDGIWRVDRLSENGASVPCRKAPDQKAALRRMAEIFRKTAEKNRRVTIAFTDDFTAAVLAGLIGSDVTFEPFDPADEDLALVYSGSLRSSPLV